MAGALNLSSDGFLIGAKELQDKLAKLSGKDAKAAVRRGLTAASKPVVFAARASIPKGVDSSRTIRGRIVGPGFASRNIKAKVIMYRSGTGGSVLVGPTTVAFYATQFVEIGTSRQARRPWLEPAFDSTKGAQVAAFGDAVEKHITKVARS